MSAQAVPHKTRPPVAVVLFDLDGTLVDSHALILAAFRHAGRVVLDRDLSDREARLRWGEPLPLRFAALAPDRVAALVDTYTAFYAAHQRRLAAAFPGVRAMLEALVRRGCRLGVVTSKRRSPTAGALDAFGLAPFITTAVTAEDTPPKPAPDPIREALRRLGAREAQALMVGDSLLDLQAARAAGVHSAAALWGAEDPDALLAWGADYVVRSPGEVVALAAAG